MLLLLNGYVTVEPTAWTMACCFCMILVKEAQFMIQLLSDLIDI